MLPVPKARVGNNPASLVFLAREAVMQKADSYQSMITGSQITDDDLRTRVLKLVKHLTSHQHVQRELMSSAMRCFTEAKAKGLTPDEIYKQISRRVLRQIQAMLLDRQL